MPDLPDPQSDRASPSVAPHPTAEEIFAAQSREQTRRRAAERRTNLLAGFLFLGALLILAALGSLDNLTGFFEKKSYLVQAHYQRIGDLKAGAPVHLGGVRVGKVKSIEREDDGTLRVLAALQIRRALPVDSTMNIESTTVSGDTFLSLIRGDSKELIRKSRDSNEQNIPEFRGNDFMNLNELGALATGIQDMASGLGSNLGMFRDKDSAFSREAAELEKNGLAVKDEYQMLLKRVGKTRALFDQASKSASRLSVQTAGLDIRLDTGGLPKKAPQLREQYQQISQSATELSQTLEQARQTFAQLKPQWSALANWGGSLNMERDSVLGVLLSDRCDGIGPTLGLFQKSIDKVSDYSLMKKLKFYFEAKDLYGKFQEDTPLTLQLDAQELYRSWITAARARKAAQLPRFPTACPLPARSR